MTEQEAIKDISENIKPYVGGKALDMAINALEEVQHYRAIGTVNEFKSLKEDWLNKFDRLIEYRKIGTLEECRAAVEKQKEMIAYCDENDCADCPFHNTNSKYNKCMNDFIAD